MAFRIALSALLPPFAIEVTSPRSRRRLSRWLRSCKCSALGFALGFATLGLLPEVALAQSEEELSEARTKFQEAIELEQAQNYSAALKLFREVGQVKFTPQIRYHIAVCEENLGHLVVALGGYELALAHSDGMHPDFIAEVESSVNDLTARIPKLVLTRGEGAEAAIIEIDGVELGDAKVGVEMPIDPGPHAVVARAPGYERFQETVEVSEGEVETLQITLVPVQQEAAPVRTVVVREEPKSFGVIPYVVGGSGLALMVMGGAFLGVTAGKVSALEELCGGTNCSHLQGSEREDAQAKERSALGFEIAGWVSLGVGAAALATGTTLFFIEKRRKRDEVARTFRLVPAAPKSDVGLSFVGTF